MVKVWDPLVRVAHWALVASIGAAWWTRHGGERLHEWLGYAALALITLRIIWGFVGSRYAQFSQFVRSPRATLAYARQIAQHTEPRHIGHNPLGAWMIVALLTMVAATGFTGWLYTTPQFWGLEWVERLHEWCSHLLLALAALHVGGVIFSSVRHRENLVAAMVTGTKRAE